MIPYARQSISEDDIQAVVEALRSDFLTQGPAVPKFEQAVAEYCGVPHAVAVNSATSALHIGCLSLGVSPGDWVWTSPNTFVATANCARYCGAHVDFVDIDPVTYNLSVERLEEKLEQAERSGMLPKVVIPVHFAGQPADMGAVHALAQRFGFYVIEDAAHAIGARYRDSVIGDCAYSDIVVFSFHPVKIITTGEGGLATTRSAELARKMQLLRSHGVTRATEKRIRPDEGPWYYEQQVLGFNYRMTDIQAALGCSQLRRLDEWVARRHELADCYDRALADLPVKLPARISGAYSAMHLYCVQIENRRRVFAALRAGGIEANVHYIPVHLHPDYQRLGFRPGQFPASEAYYARAISLPMYPALTVEQQDNVIAVLRGAVQQEARE